MSFLPNIARIFALFLLPRRGTMHTTVLRAIAAILELIRVFKPDDTFDRLLRSATFAACILCDAAVIAHALDRWHEAGGTAIFRSHLHAVVTHWL